MKFIQRPQRRRSGKTGPSISLFPFLAVLICMMGALVPLLLAITRTVRLQAEADARSKITQLAVQRNVELQTQRENVQWRVEQLKTAARATESQLADARLELGHLEDHSRRLRDQLKRHENTIDEIERLENADRGKRDQTAVELRQIEQGIEVARQQLGETVKTATERNRSYAVVPYEGPNQTRRRPIYIECRAEAVVLQPEGIALTEDDFEGPMGPGNPLAAALRATREYLLAQREFDPQAGEPYPMLLVRPSGIAAYYAARAAMKSWGNDFGYELIGDDWNLAFQPPNPQLADVVRQTLGSARIAQARLIAAAPRQYARRKVQYRASNNGGFVPDGNADGEEMATDAGGHGTGGEYNPYIAVADRPGAAVPGGSAYGNDYGTASGPSLGNDNIRGQTPRGGGDAVASSDAYGNAYGTAGGTANGPPLGNDSLNANGSSATGRTGSPGATGQVSGGGMMAENASENSPHGQGPTVRGGSGENVANTHNRYVTNAGQSTASASNGNAPNNGQTVERPEGYVVGRPVREQSSLVHNAADPSSSGVARGQPLRPGEWEPTPEPPPKPRDEEKNDPFNKKKMPPSLAERRGEDWGLRDAARGSVGVTRPIRVELYADRLVIRADRNPADDKVIPLGPRTASSIDLFISTVWERMERWGIAGRGMYWRPLLQVSVASGAEQRFAEFSALLEGSGLTVERKR